MEKMHEYLVEVFQDTDKPVSIRKLAGQALLLDRCRAFNGDSELTLDNVLGCCHYQAQRNSPTEAYGSSFGRNNWEVSSYALSDQYKSRLYGILSGILCLPLTQSDIPVAMSIYKKSSHTGVQSQYYEIHPTVPGSDVVMSAECILSCQKFLGVVLWRISKEFDFLRDSRMKLTIGSILSIRDVCSPDNSVDNASTNDSEIENEHRMANFYSQDEWLLIETLYRFSNDEKTLRDLIMRE